MKRTGVSTFRLACVCTMICTTAAGSSIMYMRTYLRGYARSMYKACLIHIDTICM